MHRRALLAAPGLGGVQKGCCVVPLGRKPLEHPFNYVQMGAAKAGQESRQQFSMQHVCLRAPGCSWLANTEFPISHSVLSHSVCPWVWIFISPFPPEVLLPLVPSSSRLLGGILQAVRSLGTSPPPVAPISQNGASPGVWAFLGSPCADPSAGGMLLVQGTAAASLL